MGYVLKSKDGGKPGKDDLALINRYTRRPFSEEEIYTFSVVLCDNEVDRDFERFTLSALARLKELFLGRTGIFDHSMKGCDQKARIYAAFVEEDGSRKTSAGEAYTRLVAKAYLPKSEKNRDFILELDSGIKKEVSVGCAVGKITCSVCGKRWGEDGCAHEKGKRYAGGVCHAVLDEPSDAYEWSFVAVPAQREAGVIKSFAPEKGGSAVEILKKLQEAGEETVLTKREAESLAGYVERLEQEAVCGRKYRDQVCKNVVRLSALAQPGLPQDVMRRTAENMSLDDLLVFEKAFQKTVDKLLPVTPQLAPEQRGKEETGRNQAFKI